jgi:hypothetical protein
MIPFRTDNPSSPNGEPEKEDREMKSGNHVLSCNRSSNVTKALSTCSVLSVFLAVLATVMPTFAQEGDYSSDAGIQVRTGRMVVLREGDYDARSYVAPRRLTGPRTKLTTAIFEVEYEGFTPEAEAAFQAAVDVWSTLIASPVVIKIKATWEPLGPRVLGSAGAPFVYMGFSGAPDPEAWYPSPLADSLHGSNLGLGVAADILASFNSNNEDWYFGTDGETPNGSWDLMSVVMHEIAHGLGFAGSATVDFSQGSWGLDGFPIAYDQFTEDDDGNLITDTSTYPNPSQELGDILQGFFVFWGGPRAVSVNEGDRPHLYAPPNWQDGSSYSHLAEEDYPAGDKDSLMTPFLNPSEAIHDPGPITLCLFQDVGWTTAQDCGFGEGSCVDDLAGGVVCLRNGRFELTATWTDFSDSAQTQPLIWTPVEDINATGGFQNNPSGIQIVMRIADSCENTNKWWIWLGGFTDAGWDITVRDTVTDTVQHYPKSPNAGVFPTTERDSTTFSCD